MMYSEASEEVEKYIDDETVGSLADLKHVERAAPVYEMTVVLLKGVMRGRCSFQANAAGQSGSTEYPAGRRNPACQWKESD